MGALVLAGLIVTGCSSDEGGPSREQPRLGRWSLTELDGEIRSQSGGRPVLCLQGSLERRPAPLYTGPSDVRSWLELHPEGALAFAFYFEDGTDYDVISNDPELPTLGFLDEAFGRAIPREAASWSFSERTIEGTVETVPGGEDSSARFDFDGTFEDHRTIAGTWSFRASARGGNCWSRSVGRGAFQATAPQ